MTTFSGYLVGISESDYTASFDKAQLAEKLKILPVISFSSSTLNGFLTTLAAASFVAGCPDALTAQNLVPGQNIPEASSNEAGLIVVSVLLSRALGAIPGDNSGTLLPQAILDRLNGTAVEKDFVG